MRADAVTMLADPVTLELDDPDGVYLDVLGVADACQAWFGTRPIWRVAPWCAPEEADRVRAALPGLAEEDRSSPADVPSLPA